MFRALLSVGGWTLVSRVTGFVRDIVMAAVLGAGGLMDVFAVAFRLPNHFRAIFGEGAFSGSFVPAYSSIRTREGPAAANLFQGRLLTFLLVSQVLLLVLALVFTPTVIQLLAPGFASEPAKFALAVEVTRLTFPYLLLITLVTLWSGALNAAGRFAAAAAAPVLLNLSLISTVLMAWLFATPAHAAGWGVLVAGVLEAVLLAVVAARAGVLTPPLRPKLDPDIRHFFRTFLPGVIGSAGVQIAMFADTIIATTLPEGSASALYYADRLYQLPMGVIAVAAGTVLLPAMSRRIAESDPVAAHKAQNSVLALTVVLAAPFWVATLLIPDIILKAVFARCAFDAAAAGRAAEVLAAYGVGLMAAVCIRSVIASFQSRGDTKTPMIVSLVSVAVNVALKLVLVGPMGVAGLALATALGASLNLALLIAIADRRGWFDPDATLGKAVLSALAGAVLLAVVFLATRALAGQWQPILQLLAAGIGGSIGYGAGFLAMARATRLSLAELKGARRARAQGGETP
jgi:putative peptidoglycan lipid II flippase